MQNTNYQMLWYVESTAFVNGVTLIPVDSEQLCSQSFFFFKNHVLCSLLKKVLFYLATVCWDFCLVIDIILKFKRQLAFPYQYPSVY